MIGRRLLLVLALGSGLLAGALYLAGTQRGSVVVAARDIDSLRPLVTDDLTTRAFPLEAVPEGAIDDARLAIGRVPRAALQRGQLILTTGLTERVVAFTSGLVAPRGTRAIALPAGPVQALGGALVPGARVDIIAVPATGRAPASRPVELLAVAALVLDVRSESGATLVPTGTSRAGGATRERIGSVVVAVPTVDELRIAERATSSTFVFVLAASDR